MSGRKISVGFVAMIDPAWMAGTKYLVNLWRVLRSASAHSYELVLLVPERVPPAEYEALAACVDRVVIYPPPLKKSIPALIVNRIRKLFSSRLDAYLKAQGIDVVFSPLDSGARLIPRIHWLPDFQHLYYPEFFTPEQLAFRLKAYPAAARKATIVAVSSQAAEEDLIRILPAVSNKIRVFPFASQLPQEIHDGDPKQAADLYQLPSRFFLLANQFWKHKNHKIVLDALEIASKSVPDLTVACTGTTVDSRDPAYFDALMARVSALSLQSNFRVLGRIPEEHLYQLMRRSLAVLQPSLFEGWNTSVEEAKSMGKIVIASDIPVHREQAPLSGRYFRADDPAALASILIELHTRGTPGPDLQAEELARADMQERVRVFAQTFDRIVEEALQQAGRPRPPASSERRLRDHD